MSAPSVNPPSDSSAQVPRLVRAPFVERMEAELQANQRKGDWREWVPTPMQVTQELNYHFAKLVFAMAQGDRERVSEFAADVANIAMKADEVLGSGSSQQSSGGQGLSGPTSCGESGSMRGR